MFPLLSEFSSIIIGGCAFFILLFLFLKLSSPKSKGTFGEYKVSSKLKSLGKEYIVLNDLLLKTANNRTSQIDHVVLSEYGIFVIETKNYKGWIFGNEKAEDWMQIIFKEKHKFRNPVKQNWSHIFALKNILKDFPNTKYFPIVVFSGSAELKKIESSVPVIYADSLKRLIKNSNKEKCLSINDILKIQGLLENNKLTDKSAKKEHVAEIHRTIIETQLKKEKLICPRCNGELKLRKGRNGKFYGCANYPNCKFTMKY